MNVRLWNIIIFAYSNHIHMAKDYSEPKNVCIRLPPGLKKAVDEDVAETGDFNSASQWYLAAVRAYLEVRKKERTGGGGPNQSH